MAITDIVEGWGDLRKSPVAPWVVDDDWLGISPHFFDHVYRATSKDGLQVFIAEPYELTEGDLRDLLALIRIGWHIHIDGLGSHHDTTIRIIFAIGKSDGYAIADFA